MLLVVVPHVGPDESSSSQRDSFATLMAPSLTKMQMHQNMGVQEWVKFPKWEKASCSSAFVMHVITSVTQSLKEDTYPPDGDKEYTTFAARRIVTAPCNKQSQSILLYLMPNIQSLTNAD